MKKVSLFLAALLIVGAAFASAQAVESKKFEVGTSVEFYGLDNSGSSAASYLNIPLRFGWYIWKGLEIEPEFTVSIPLKYTASLDTTVLGTLNAFYNYKIGKKFVPFAGGGFSLGNGVPYANNWQGDLYGDAKMNTTALNLGGGLKYLLSDSCLLRLEYRYSRYRITYDGEDNHDNFNLHRVFIGFSYMF